MGLTKEQIELRKRAVGASEAAAALGLSKWKTPLALYLQKRGEAEPTAEEKREWRYGHAVEPFIISEFEMEKGVTLVRSPDTMRKGDLVAHLDAMLPQQYAVQAKSARRREGWGAPDTDQIPVDYWVQCQAEMLASGLTLAYVPVWFFGSDLAIYEVRGNPTVQAQIEAGVAEFMDRVRRGIPPPPVSLGEVDSFYRQSIPRATVVPQEIATAAEALAQMRESIKAMDIEADAAEARIKRAMGDFEVAMHGGQVIATWRRCADSERIDTKRLRQEEPEIAKKFSYLQPGGRRFLLKL